MINESFPVLIEHYNENFLMLSYLPLFQYLLYVTFTYLNIFYIIISQTKDLDTENLHELQFTQHYLTIYVLEIIESNSIKC